MEGVPRAAQRQHPLGQARPAGRVLLVGLAEAVDADAAHQSSSTISPARLRNRRRPSTHSTRSDDRGHQQARPVRPLAADEDALVGGDDRCHRIPAKQDAARRLRQDRRRVDDRRKPEPKLHEDPEELPHIAEEDIEHAERDAQPDGEGDLHSENRNRAKKRPAREVARYEQEEQEQSEDDREVEPALRMTMTGSVMRGKLSFFIRLAWSRKMFWARPTISANSPHVSSPAQR